MQPKDVYPISARDVVKTFGERRVLDGLSLQVQRGNIVGLLGSNGSGKTSLLRVLLALLPRNSGPAEIGGENSESLPPEIRERIGYVPQATQLFVWLTGGAMLQYLGAFYPNYDHEYALSIADRLQVSLKTGIEALSPGQQQRLSIVRALSTRPEILILDEPMSALDPAARISVIDEMIREHRARGITIVVSSHIVHDLQRYCTHLAVLKDGRVAVHQPIDFFTGLLRVVVTGEESVLASTKFTQAGHVRSSQPGERSLVITPDSLPALERELPAGLSIRQFAGDLEAVLSEWMR